MGTRPRASRGYALIRILVTLAVVGSPSIGDARIETLRWKDSDPDPTRIEGFVVHSGPDSRSYDTSVDVGWPTPDADGIFSYDLTVPDDASVYVAVTAYDAELESDYSNEKLLARTVPDFDGDGVVDHLDNCSEAANPAQDDTDGDGCGNLCDADYDQTSTVGFGDLGFFTQYFGTTNPLCQHLEPIGTTGRLCSFGDLGFFTENFGKVPGPSGTTAGTTACP